jgi:hypothetical protein
VYIDEYPLCSIFTALFPADPQSRPFRKARHAQSHSNHESDNERLTGEKKEFDSSYVISRGKKDNGSFLARFALHIESETWRIEIKQRMRIKLVLFLRERY